MPDKERFEEFERRQQQLAEELLGPCEPFRFWPIPRGWAGDDKAAIAAHNLQEAVRNNQTYTIRRLRSDELCPLVR